MSPVCGIFLTANTNMNIICKEFSRIYSNIQIFATIWDEVYTKLGEEAAREREGARNLMRTARESQDRKAKFVNRIQAKLVKYRDEAAEAKELVNHLSSQAWQDQSTIKKLTARAEVAEQEPYTAKVSHCLLQHLKHCQEVAEEERWLQDPAPARGPVQASFSYLDWILDTPPALEEGPAQTGFSYLDRILDTPPAAEGGPAQASSNHLDDPLPAETHLPEALIMLEIPDLRPRSRNALLAGFGTQQEEREAKAPLEDKMATTLSVRGDEGQATCHQAAPEEAHGEDGAAEGLQG